MKKVYVKNTVNGTEFGGPFEDPSAFIAENIEANSWGLPERWVHERSVSDEEKQRALDSRTVTDRDAMPATEEVTLEDGTVIPAGQEVPEVTHIEYKVPADYTIEVTDITEEYNMQMLREKGQRAQAFGNQVIAFVYSTNESNPNMTPAIFQTMLGDPTLQTIERLLKNGSLKTARAMIAGMGPTAYFTQDQVNAVLSMIDNSGLL